MDRFIVSLQVDNDDNQIDLKSNMDRFIGPHS